MTTYRTDYESDLIARAIASSEPMAASPDSAGAST